MPSAAESLYQPTVALPATDHLGEGPFWDRRSNQLIHVDINRGAVHRWKPGSRRQETTHLGAPVSFAIPRKEGGLIVGRQHSVCALEVGGSQRTLATLRDRDDDVRFNDAKCDGHGRLWAGTMSTSRTPGVGALYRLAPQGELEAMVDGTTISNGIGWSPDWERMYFIDSTTQRIDLFDFDLATGELANRRMLAEIDAADGLPDGLAVDAQDRIWVCLFGGGAVRCYSSAGQLEHAIELPVSNPTCPCFGGERLDTLYVTTAQHRLTRKQLGREPLAGSLFSIPVGARGLAMSRFAG